MKKYSLYLLGFLLMTISVTGCEDSLPVIHDLSQRNFALVNQDSAAVDFPAEYAGKYLVVAFIYTHCPDICLVTTANMKNAFNALDDTSDVRFVEISFDPLRDTPSVLKDYMKKFKLDDRTFTMLTGDSTSVDSVLTAMDVDAAITYRDTIDAGKPTYIMNHTDRIAIMDPQGRVRFEYPGSKVPVEHIVEDLNKIR